MQESWLSESALGRPAQVSDARGEGGITEHTVTAPYLSNSRCGTGFCSLYCCSCVTLMQECFLTM